MPVNLRNAVVKQCKISRESSSRE